ncbi:hypothetical protein AVEN_182238-1 [Araneus ventricosus]|uniref:Uncharacterized protein n=1 Tax=Araneus ventricosus TaxID=182803 RepID=A0A4Y2KRF8_ARAVE|nr:hypothetical protein AVEN_182238-1 [Araneus ventricosus]
MDELIVDKSPTTEKKSETSISNSVEMNSVQDGQSYSAAHYRSTAKKLSAVLNAAAAVSKPVKKSNTSAVKRTTGKGSKTVESATKKRKASRDKSPEKKAAAAKDKKPRKTSKDASGKKAVQAKAAKSTKKKQ